MLEKALVVAAALAGSVFTAIGIVVRQRATMDVPPDRGVSTLMLRTLLRRPLWWAGTGAAVVGYLFYAVALAYGSLLLVAPLLVVGTAVRASAERVGVAPAGDPRRVGLGHAAHRGAGRVRLAGAHRTG